MVKQTKEHTQQIIHVQKHVADIEIQLTELHQDTQRQTKMAMTKSSIDLLAMLTAEQDVAAAIFATKTIRTSNSMAE